MTASLELSAGIGVSLFISSLVLSLVAVLGFLSAGIYIAIAPSPESPARLDAEWVEGAGNLAAFLLTGCLGGLATMIFRLGMLVRYQTGGIKDDKEDLYVIRNAANALEGLERSLLPMEWETADRLLEGIDKHAMSQWRLIGAYPAAYLEEAAEAPALAEPCVCAAVALSRYAACCVEARVGARSELDCHRASLDRISARLDDCRLRTGQP